MPTSIYHPQRKAQHGSGGTLRCGMGRAAPIADGYQFQKRRVSSSLPTARNEKPRATCRGFAASAFLFPAGVTDPDALAEFRMRRAAGLLPEQIAASFSASGNAGSRVSTVFEPGLYQPMRKPAHIVRLSSVAVFDDRDRDREAQGSVPNPSGEFPTVRGTFQHECC